MKDTLVVTATLGGRDTLKRTIQKVHEIGGSRVKHLIIAPEEVCCNLRIIFPYLEILTEPHNCKGIYPALNFALFKHARDYKYLAFINDDDHWLPNYNKLFEILDNNSKIDVAYGRVIYINEDDKILTEQTSSGRYKAFGTLLHRKIVLFTQQATLMRSNLFLKLDGFDESFKLVADTKFWIDAIESKAKFKYINTVCAAYTLQVGQLSSNATLQHEEYLRLFANMYQPNKINVIKEAILFRLSNIKIYIKRLFGLSALTIDKLLKQNNS